VKQALFQLSYDPARFQQLKTLFFIGPPQSVQRLADEYSFHLAHLNKNTRGRGFSHSCEAALIV
jgi:hypothetical protein